MAANKQVQRNVPSSGSEQLRRRGSSCMEHMTTDDEDEVSIDCV
jgi:hypothetical protein